MPSSTLHGLCLSAALLLPASTALWAADATTAGTATATAPSSTWIAFAAPFTGDDDRDGWTVFELGLAPGGPFDVAEVWKIPGPPEWRAETFRGLAADTDYYVQVTFVDPDGVSGSNPQVVGPVHSLASAPDAVTLGTATASVGDAEILLSQPISGDANGNSLGIVELATDPGGPWTERCGSPSENRLPYHPRRCRLRSLTPGTDYWVRIDNSDPDGVSGTDPQLLGPIPYTGRANLAAGRPITADPGWGCCPNPALLVDGRIQYRFWPYGFAWTGGTTGYGGGPAGWKQATIDLGAGSIFDRVEVWLHGPNSPPTDWRLETSDDGASWSEVWATTDPQCRGAAEQLSGTSWQHPNCSQGASFAPVTARYLRYWFDDRTLFGGLHGWAVELEVLAPPPPDTTAPTDPTAVASTTHTPSSWSLLQEITVEWSGATDEGSAGVAGYSVLFDTSPATLPDATIDVAHTADPHDTTSSPLSDGQSHWFHLRTCDGADNCTATTHLGPFWIDTVPPEVGLVATVADTGDGVLSEAEVSGVPVTQLLVTFDEQVVGAADTANFLLLRDGGDGFQTVSCTAGADPGDEVMALDTASYSAAALTSTLGVHGGIPLLDGDYRLFACASPSISDLAGNALDGNGNGTGGDDFTRSFTLLDTRPTAHPGADRTIDVDEGINLGNFPAATGGTPPYAYLWTVTPDAAVDLSSTTEAHPTLSCATPEILTAELTVSDVSGLESPTTAAEITVICPPRRDLYNADYYDIRLFEATELITAEEVVIRTGANVSFNAGESVILLDGFEVETDAVLRILIEPATDCS